MTRAPLFAVFAFSSDNLASILTASASRSASRFDRAAGLRLLDLVDQRGNLLADEIQRLVCE
jgi:hypothetical protein